MYKLIADETHFVVVSKDSGISFHGEGFVAKIKEDTRYELFPVHRIDKITSGLLIFAKTKEVADKLSKMFQNKTIDKTYLALSDQRPGKKQGQIKGDLKKTRNGSYKLLRSMDNPSMTSFHSSLLEDTLRLFILSPITGRTHQLRVVMKSLGSPILGDMRYGGSEADRGYLHCYALKFNLDDISYSFQFFPDSGKKFLKYEHKIKEIINGKSI